MLLHVSTFKMSSSGSSLCLAKITYRFYGFSKIKIKQSHYRPGEALREVEDPTFQDNRHRKALGTGRLYPQ
jgi:hypothetical protein